jgi:hypothetical protein
VPGDDVVDLSSWGGELSVEIVCCWARQGKRKAIVGVGPNVELARRQMLAVLAGGLLLEVYVYPYYEAEPARYLDRVDAATAGLPVGFRWLDFEDTETLPGGYNWQTFVVLWIHQCMNEAAARWGPEGIGLYTGAWWWQQYTADSTEGASWPLWAADYDGEANASFTPFGGWTRCRIKQYSGTTELCEFSVDLDFEEGCEMDAETEKQLKRSMAYQRWGAMVMTGDDPQIEQALRELVYVRLLAGLPAVPPAPEDK